MNKRVRLPLGLRTLSKLSFPHKIGILDRVYGRMLAKQGESWVSINSRIDWKLDLADTTQRWIIYDSYEMQMLSTGYDPGSRTVESQ